MATEYTTSKPEIVFLNDKCIAQKGADIDTIDYNAIPSLSLFNNVENALVEKDAALELSVNEISGTVKSNINDVDVLNKHVKSTYAVFNNFDFEYSRDRHSIELTLKNSSATAISDTTMLSIDTTDFIRDRVISTILVKGDDLWIYWNEHDYIAVRLSSLAQIYDAGEGIVIGSDGSGPYIISADDTKIASKSVLDDVEKTVNTLSEETVPAISTQVGEIQTYVDKLSSFNPPGKTPGIIQGLQLSDENLADQISKLRSDVSATVAIAGHISLKRGAHYGDDTLSAIFKKFNLLESGTLRSGNTYSVEFVDVDDTSLSNLSSTYIMTKDREPIRLAYGDYITIHSHTPDPVTADSLTANIIISPEIKPFQLYSLSTVVHNLSTALSVEIQTLSTNLSTDLSVENIRAMSVETELSDAISSKIYIDDVSTESLCAIHCSMDKYYRRVIDGDVLSNELYILSGEYVNVYNRKIKYVDTPVDSSDATTKGYVDDAISKLSTELSTQISALSNNISADVKRLSTELSTQISALSNNISADVKRLSTELSTQISALSNNISADLKCLSTEVIDVSTLLSNDISCKIGADGRYLSTLSILHIDDDDYYDLVKNNHVNSDTLYIVSGDYNNAYDLQVKYVAAPTDGDDATNKTYVDGKFTEVDDRVTTLSSALMTELSVFADDTKTPDLYTISKALSAIYAAIK